MFMSQMGAGTAGVTIPARFDDNTMQFTDDSGEIGLLRCSLF